MNKSSWSSMQLVLFLFQLEWNVYIGMFFLYCPLCYVYIHTHTHGRTHDERVHAQSSWLNDSLSQPLNLLVLETDWQDCAALVNNSELQVLEGGLTPCSSLLLLYLVLPMPGPANGGAVLGWRAKEGREEGQTEADRGTPRCQMVNRGSPVEPCPSPTAQTMQCTTAGHSVP